MSDFVSQSSATNADAATAVGTNRLASNSNVGVFVPGRTFLPKQSVYIPAEDLVQDKPSTNTIPEPKTFKNIIPLGFKWNLPPHDWSIPTRPSDVDPYVIGHDDVSSFHGLRRGRIWFFTGAEDIGNLNTSTGEIVKAKATNISDKEATQVFTTDRKWGFQFLWNPENINSNVSRNMDITPSSADSLRVVSGAFPGQESFSVNIVLDRVNDFACSRANRLIINNDGTAVTTYSLSAYKRYYSSGEFPGADLASIPFEKKISDVMAQGTMADLEYLFKAINGTLTLTGGASAEWANLLGKKTANIGYLQPSLMAFQFGPTLDNLAWVGWISNIQLNHTMFTETMIPIRTEVSISAEAFTGSGIGSA